MHKQLIVIAFLGAAAGAFGQTKSFDAAACARFAEDSLVNRSVPHYVPEECYSAQTVDLSHNMTPERIREIVQLLNLSLNFVNVDVDASAFTLKVHGSPEKLAATNWLLRELDQPAAKEAHRVDRYTISPGLQKELMPLLPQPPDADSQSLGVFFLSNADRLGVQELWTMLRIVGDVRTVDYDSAGRRFVLRGSESQLAVVKYFIDALDVAPGTAAPVPDFSTSSGVIHLFFPGQSVALDYQIMRALRDVIEVKTVFNFTASAAIAVRGTGDEIAAADWLIRALESKASDGAHEFRFADASRPDNVMKVFYQPHGKIDTLKSSAFDSPAALLVRGSASQIAEAEREMQ